jgi:hypothetical protein
MQRLYAYIPEHRGVAIDLKSLPLNKQSANQAMSILSEDSENPVEGRDSCNKRKLSSNRLLFCAWYPLPDPRTQYSFQDGTVGIHNVMNATLALTRSHLIGFDTKALSLTPGGELDKADTKCAILKKKYWATGSESE